MIFIYISLALIVSETVVVSVAPPAFLPPPSPNKPCGVTSFAPFLGFHQSLISQSGFREFEEHFVEAVRGELSDIRGRLLVSPGGGGTRKGAGEGGGHQVASR